jgi:uncharacterized membrane protein
MIISHFKSCKGNRKNRKKGQLAKKYVIMAMMHKYFIIFKTILKTSATDIILLINCDELLDKLLIFVMTKNESITFKQKCV